MLDYSTPFKQFILIAGLLSVSSFYLNGQSRQDVAEQTLKVGGLGQEEVLYYGFAEGDQIVFNFEEIDGKPLKEIEILEYPNSSKFMNYKTSKITDKVIKVNQTGVYKFRFLNSAVSGRVCRIRIERIPANMETEQFNCSVFWKTVSDTTWITKTRQVVASIDTVYDEISSIENQIMLNSKTNPSCLSNGASCTKNKMKLTYHPDTEEMYVYIVADQKTAQAFNDLAKTLGKTAVKTGLATATLGSSVVVDMFTNNLTSSAIDKLPVANSGNEIDIFFTDKTSADNWFVDYDNRISTYEGLAFKGYVTLKQRLIKSQIPKDGMYLCLKNNQISTGVPVFVEIVAKRIVKVFKEEIYHEPHVTTHEVPYLKN